MRIHDYMKIIEKLPLGKPNLPKKDSTESEKMQNELEPISEPLSSKIKLHDKTGVPASGSVVVGGVITHIGGMAVDWTFHTTDDDMEFEHE